MQTMEVQNCMVSEDEEQHYQIEDSHYLDSYYDDYSYHNEDYDQHASPIDRLFANISMDIENKKNISCMDQGWTLMLYSFTSFNSDRFDDLIDQEQTGRKILKYTEEYVVSSIQGRCQICLNETLLLNNSCGHVFCSDCWISHIRQKGNRTNGELFPFCAQEGCYHYTNYQLMQVLWGIHPQMKKQFHNLLCLKYCQNSRSIKICPNLHCGNVIEITNLQGSTAECQCGIQMCKHCGKAPHEPLECSDLYAWDNIRRHEDVLGSFQESYKKCPACNQLIDKNKGCILMTCVCTYQFCWICLKPWKGHQSYFQCVSQLHASDNKLKQKVFDQENYELFETANAEIERLSASIARVQSINLNQLKACLFNIFVLQIDTDVLEEMVKFIAQAWKLVQRCVIYIYFKFSHFQFLEVVVHYINLAANRLDDYLFDEFSPKMYQNPFLRIKNKGKNETLKVSTEKLKNNFLEERRNFFSLMSESRRMIKKIKEGKIWEAFEDVNYYNSLKYLDEKEGKFFKNL